MAFRMLEKIEWFRTLPSAVDGTGSVKEEGREVDMRRDLLRLGEMEASRGEVYMSSRNAAGQDFEKSGRRQE